MRIPNKFNGYSADNIRLYNDPVTLTALTAAGAGTGTMAGTALLGTGAAAAGAAGAASTIPTLAGAGALGSMSGGTLAAAAPSLAPVASSAGLGILPEAAGILPQTLGGAQGVMSGAAQAAVPAVEATTAAIPVDQVAAAGQNLGSASSTPFAPPAVSPPAAPAPGVPSLPNVSTTPPVDQAAASKAYYETAANQASNELNRGIAQKVGEQYTAGGDPLTSGFDKAMNYAQKNPLTTAGGLYSLSKFTDNKPSGGEKSKGSNFRHEDFNAPMMNPLLYGANGGIMSSYADGGPVEQMSNMNAIGGNEMYPMANIPRLEYANPVQQRPVSENIMTMGGDTPTDPYTGQLKFAKGGTTDDDNGMTRFRKQLAKQEAEREALGESLYSHARAKVEDRGIVSRPLSESSTDPYTASINRMKKAHQVAGIKMQEMPKLNMPESFSVTEAAGGGIMRGDLGGYSDGGRLLKGPGDGVSDSIPAVIGNKQPARLADGEFVVPARIVSELGNGSTEAGARKLYAMMERIQKGRKKSVGKGKVAVNSKAAKHLPA
jgi:hypothetical protein